MTPLELLRAREAYGADPRPNHERIAALWSAVLGIDIAAEQVALCMVLVKVSRLCQTPDHADSIDDLAGYSLLYRLLVGSGNDGTSGPNTDLDDSGQDLRRGVPEGAGGQ